MILDVVNQQTQLPDMEHSSKILIMTYVMKVICEKNELLDHINEFLNNLC